MRNSTRLLMVSLVLGATALAAGCDNNIDGMLQVKEPLTLRDEKGRDFTIATSRKINVDPENVGDIGDEEVKLKLEDDAGKDRKVKLEVPSYKQIPENGTLKLEASETGQAFDLLTDVRTVRATGNQYRTYESCTYTTTEYRCWHGPNGQTCGYVTVQHNGRREVVQHDETIDVRATSWFLKPGNGATLATFQGARNDRYTVTDWRGNCGWGW